MMRGVLHHFISREYRNGPFVLTLTDLHRSNILVDDEWHITSLIDLEWTCSLPIELQCPPHTGCTGGLWMTSNMASLYGRSTASSLKSSIISKSRRGKERCRGDATDIFQAPIMRECWNRWSFWYFQAMNSPKGLLRIFNQHIQHMFCEEHCTKRVFNRVVSPYWAVGAEKIIKQKIKKEDKYKKSTKRKICGVFHRHLIYFLHFSWV